MDLILRLDERAMTLNDYFLCVFIAQPVCFHPIRKCYILRRKPLLFRKCLIRLGSGWIQVPRNSAFTHKLYDWGWISTYWL